MGVVGADNVFTVAAFARDVVIQLPDLFPERLYRVVGRGDSVMSLKRPFASASGSFRNSCTSPSRFFVGDESISLEHQ